MPKKAAIERLIYKPGNPQPESQVKSKKCCKFPLIRPISSVY